MVILSLVDNISCRDSMWFAGGHDEGGEEWKRRLSSGPDSLYGWTPHTGTSSVTSRSRSLNESGDAESSEPYASDSDSDVYFDACSSDSEWGEWSGTFVAALPYTSYHLGCRMLSTSDWLHPVWECLDPGVPKFSDAWAQVCFCSAESDDSDIGLDQFGYNPATDQLLQDIEQDDQEDAHIWPQDMQQDEDDEHSWKEPRYRSATWFALRKDQLVYSGTPCWCQTHECCRSLHAMLSCESVARS